MGHRDQSPTGDGVAPGTMLGPYELLLPIGSGGMADVWVARTRATGERVALKMLHPELADTPTFQAMFLDEARIASRIRHPNVCATFNLAEHDGVLCLAMEWIDGGSVLRMLRPDGGETRIPFPTRIAARIVADACAGLHAAHELVDREGRRLEVIHRDVSPPNILVTADGRTKVTDFGVAKAVGRIQETVAGQIKGKLAYMSPEQLTRGHLDRRSDVFALGAVLYEMTTGKRPFAGHHDAQVMRAIVTGTYELPSAIVAEYPRDLEAIVCRALAFDPQGRFPTTDAMRGALEAYLLGERVPVTTADVARLLEERCGAEIATRAVELSAARETLPDSGNVDSGHVAIHPSPPPPATRTRPYGTIAAAAFVGGAIGLAIVIQIANVRRDRNAADAIAAMAMRRAVPAGQAPVAPGTPARPSSAPHEIRVKVTPASAALVADGVPLPRGTLIVPRPLDGRTVNLLVRADEHEDTTVLIDPSTPDEIEVSLLQVAAATAPRVSATGRPAAGGPMAKSVPDAPAAGGPAAAPVGTPAADASAPSEAVGNRAPARTDVPAAVGPAAPPNPYE